MVGRTGAPLPGEGEEMTGHVVSCRAMCSRILFIAMNTGSYILIFSMLESQTPRGVLLFHCAVPKLGGGLVSSGRVTIDEAGVEGRRVHSIGGF